MFKMKSIIPWAIAAAAVTAAVAYPLSAAKPSSAASANSAAVTSVMRAERVEASGSIQAQTYASLAWKTSGTVETIAVSVGDQVQAGDVLMRLETGSASANVISAQADLLNAQKQRDALANPDGKARADAQKVLAGAYTAWDGARDSLSETLLGKQSSGDEDLYDEVEGAEADLNEALDAFALTASADAQWYFWAVRMETLGRTGDYDFSALKTSLRAALESEDADLVDDIAAAQKQYEQSAADFAASIDEYADANQLNSAVAAYQQSAEALLTASQSAYETLVSANPDDLAAAQAKVDAAQATVNSLGIIAPFDGEVLSIEQRPGDVVSTGTLAIALADRGKLYIDTQVDEADIALVAVGNSASISLDAMPGAQLKGVVTMINPVSQTISGLVKYNVRIELDPIEEPMLLGASADVIIEVSAEHSALALPASAVKSDEDGEYVLLIETSGSLRRVAVQSGDSLEGLVIVSGDLQAGDLVEADYQSGVQAPNPLGGN